jgi:hypothetical protein
MFRVVFPPIIRSANSCIYSIWYCHTVTATYRYRGRIGTALSVLWVACSLFISGNCSTCFGWNHHSSSGAQTVVSTASGICHTLTATCRYRGRVGTGLSVLWVAYATHSTLKPIPTLPR